MGRFLAPLLVLGPVGCVPLFYAYPTLSYTPAVAFGPEHEGIYAFRVDIAEDSAGPGQYRLRDLPINRAGYLMGQGKPAFDEGYYWNLFVQTYARQIGHTLRVRLYRPGYELAEIQSWHTGEGVRWHAVDGSEGRERAIDALLANSSGNIFTGENGKPFAHLEPGSASPDHREALRFAAREYERAAFAAADREDDEVNDRCSGKAKWLKELADR